MQLSLSQATEHCSSFRMWRCGSTTVSIAELSEVGCCRSDSDEGDAEGGPVDSSANGRALPTS